jgi:hypothetical protein
MDGGKPRAIDRRPVGLLKPSIAEELARRVDTPASARRNRGYFKLKPAESN